VTRQKIEIEPIRNVGAVTLTQASPIEGEGF